MRPANKRPASGRSAAAPRKRSHARQTARPFISACLIVKNEEANLPRCLGSVAPLVDEIVLVDTGSTDRTVEIAQEFGARVFHFDWCDDFSAARNESLRHATGEWIIWVDGDDELVEAEPGALRRLCQAQPGPDWGYWVEVRSPYGDTGELEVAVQHWRIFRNERGVWFRGRVHEEPWPPQPIEPSQIVEQASLHVMHWGYIPQGDLMQRKSERNRHLLELSLAEDPAKPIHYYNLGRQLCRERDYAGAFERFNQGLQLWEAQGGPNWSFAHSLFSFAAQAAVETGHFERALEIEGKTPPHLVSAELLCETGKALWQLGRREEAITRLNRAWQDPSVIHQHLHDVSKSTWQPLLMLSGLYDQTDDTARAYECARKALEFAPEHPEVLLAAGYLAAKEAHLEEGITLLRRLLAGQRDDGFKVQARGVLLQLGQKTDQPEVVLEALSGDAAGINAEQAIVLRADAHGRLGNLQARYDELQAGLNAYPAGDEVRFALADLLAENGYDAEAVNLLGAMLDRDTCPPDVYRRLGPLLAKLGRMEDAANALQMYAQLVAAADRQPATAA
jgi:tetratricopeptide (TPR) repeat protein